MEPTFSAAYTVRGRYLEEHGDPRAAADAYQRALMTDARDQDAAEGLARVVGRP
jgi:predicted TPR repeat methyltransferase